MCKTRSAICAADQVGRVCTPVGEGVIELAPTRDVKSSTQHTASLLAADEAASSSARPLLAVDANIGGASGLDLLEPVKARLHLCERACTGPLVPEVFGSARIPH